MNTPMTTRTLSCWLSLLLLPESVWAEFETATGAVTPDATLVAGNGFALPQGPVAHILRGAVPEANPPPMTVSGGEPIPAWFPKAPPLAPPRGETIPVATADELLAAVDRVGPGGTIFLADGHYRFPRVMVLRQKRDITIRGASGDPAKVTLSGQGWDSRNQKGVFVEPASGNLALRPGATGAIDQAEPRPEVTGDIRGWPRRERPDLGAWEFEAEPQL